MQSQNRMMLEDGICTIGFIDNQFILLWAHIYFTTYEYSLLYLNMFLYQSQLCYQAIYLSWNYESYQLDIFLCCGLSLCVTTGAEDQIKVFSQTAIYYKIIEKL